MKHETSVFSIGAILFGLMLIRLVGNGVKLIRSLARLWADRQVRRMFGDWQSILVAVLDRIGVPRERRVVPGSPRRARVEHWIEAGVMCLYVGFLLVLAAVVATVALCGLLEGTAVGAFPEVVAFGFVCLLWVVAEFYYKEALRLRSEVTGLPLILA